MSLRDKFNAVTLSHQRMGLRSTGGGNPLLDASEARVAQLIRERDALRAALTIAKDAMTTHMWHAGLFYVRSGQYARDIKRIRELEEAGGSH